MYMYLLPLCVCATSTIHPVIASCICRHQLAARSELPESFLHTRILSRKGSRNDVSSTDQCLTHSKWKRASTTPGDA
jgi:hypothetical protein